MTQKGFKILEFLIKYDYQSIIKSVTSSRDINLVKDYYDEIKTLCDSNNIAFYNKTSTNKTKAEYSIAISWRWIIKDVVKLIVLHDSLLPKYRGFAPLVNSLKNGEEKIGVTALYAVEEYDKGDIIFQSSQQIKYPITIQQAIDRITTNYFEAVKFIFEKIKKGESIQAQRQNEEEATYSLWLDEEDYSIDWKQSSEFIKRFIDATGYPYAGAFSIADGIKLRILEAQVEEDVFIENRKEGKVIFFKNEHPVVVCGKGLIKLSKIISDTDGLNVLPLKKFRVRFT